MSDWNSFLVAQGATFSPDGFSDFATAPEDTHKTWLVDLSHQGILAIEGPDAAKFLQGQVTCDVRELENQTTRLGAQCDLKGRMLHSFRALQPTADQILLRLNAGLIGAAQSALGKYIVFSKAKLHDRSDSCRQIGLSGPNAADLLTRHLGVPPQSPEQWTEHSGNLIIKLDEQRYECWIKPEQAEHLWQALAPDCQLGGGNIWRLLDIRAGIGEVLPSTQGVFTPQALNFQLINGVSFRKGCYTGQEIVARLHYRGKLKRHMYRVQFELGNDALLPDSGASVFNHEQKAVGEIVMAARISGNMAEALAVIADDQLEQSYLGSQSSQKLTPLALPYAIPVEKED